MELSRDDIIIILNTVRETGYQYFNLEVAELKVTMGNTAPALQPSAPSPVDERGVRDTSPSREPTRQEPPANIGDDAVVASQGQHVLTAPVVGMFYWSPVPNDPPYVAVGDRVRVGDTVGLIEVMKVYNSVACDVSGTVVELLAENNTAVEYGQPLLVIEPDTD